MGCGTYPGIYRTLVGVKPCAPASGSCSVGRLGRAWWFGDTTAPPTDSREPSRPCRYQRERRSDFTAQSRPRLRCSSPCSTVQPTLASSLRTAKVFSSALKCPSISCTRRESNDSTDWLEPVSCAAMRRNVLYSSSVNTFSGMCPLFLNMALDRSAHFRDGRNEAIVQEERRGGGGVWPDLRMSSRTVELFSTKGVSDVWQEWPTECGRGSGERGFWVRIGVGGGREASAAVGGCACGWCRGSAAGEAAGWCARVCPASCRGSGHAGSV